MNTDIYGQIQTLAEQAGISVRALCQRAGVSPGTITRWRKGQTLPSFRIWQKLTEAARHGDKKEN